MTQLCEWPVKRLDGMGVPGPCGRITYHDSLDTIHVELDSGAFSFFMEASPQADPNDIEQVLDGLFASGFELMDEGECPATVNERGWTRIYLVPLVPVDDTPIVAAVESAGRADQGFIKGALVALGAATLGTYPVYQIVGALLEVAGS